MKSLLSLFAAVCCVGALSAQTTVLSEDFNANVVPPSGWTTQNLNGSISAGWVSDLNGQAYHADEAGVGMCDNILATPAMDLSGLTEAYLHMTTFMGYITYLDSQSVDVSTDGGATWTLVWSDLGFNDATTQVDISAYAGQASVMLGFHYVGDYAHNTLIDDVVVDDVDASGGGGPPAILEEDFNAGVVPPAGWTTQNLNGSASAGWVASAGKAYHADEYGVGMCDNILATPAMDLSGETEAYVHFDTFMGYITYLDSQSVDVSTDGGATWTMVWSDLGLNNAGDTVDISAYAGMASVMVGFHYVGDYAHNTSIDNVRVDNDSGMGGGGLTYAISGLTAGQVATFSVTGAAAGDSVTMAYSLTGAGPVNSPYGLADMSMPITILNSMYADANGDALFSRTVPGGAAGRTLYTQAVANSVLTNSLVVVVQ
ncbi:MAG: choice-of-anchor J domain-containing protein [Planctomycetota bacterium]